MMKLLSHIKSEMIISWNILACPSHMLNNLTCLFCSVQYEEKYFLNFFISFCIYDLANIVEGEGKSLIVNEKFQI